MKTLKFWVLLCLSLCASVAFARKGYEEQKINVPAFDELDICGTYMATLEKSDRYEMVLEVPEQLMTYARTRIVNNKVMLSFDMDRMTRSEKQYLSEHRPYVRIKAPAFRKLDISGATYMELKGNFNLGDAELEMSGASNFNAGALKAKNFEMEISGASHIKVHELIADELDLDISGATHCNLSAVEAKKLKVDLSGASHLELKAFAKYADVDVSGMSHCDWEPLNDKVGERLEVEVSGMSKMNAGKIRYRKISKDVSGMSKLKIGNEIR